MKSCPQTDTQSIFQHGLSVKCHMFQLIEMLRTNTIQKDWKLPDWFFQYKDLILNDLLSDQIIEEYTLYHDCGKPYCIEYDMEGKRHFPNHAEISYKKWLEVGGSPEAALLMKMDMDIHNLKSKDIDEFASRPQAITLLLAGLAEIHSNAAMFGGVNSTSFKIKWKQINTKGKVVCQKLNRG